MDLNDLVLQIEALADSEKLALVDIILSKLDKPDPEIDSVWASETRNRWKAYKAGSEVYPISKPKVKEIKVEKSVKLTSSGKPFFVKNNYSFLKYSGV